jgi:hypothetical protein
MVHVDNSPNIEFEIVAPTYDDLQARFMTDLICAYGVEIKIDNRLDIISKTTGFAQSSILADVHIG